MHKPESCGKCGAEPQEHERCARCGEAEWVLHHGVHYMQGAREVVVCDCPSPRSALGRRMKQARARQEERELTGKRPPGRPGKDHPVTTPEMARKAAEGSVRGLSPTAALREAGFPPSTVKASRRGINRMIRAELGKLGRKYIRMGKELTPEDQEAIVRGRLFENVITGTDRGTMSAKQLGSGRRISMWRSDSQVGLVILQPPPIPKIDHPVPWIESKAMKLYKEKEKPVALTPVTEPRPREVDMSYRQARAERH